MKRTRLTYTLAATWESIGASTSHCSTSSIFVAIVYEGYLLSEKVKIGQGLLVFITGYSDFDETVETREYTLQFLFVDVWREVTDIETYHSFHLLDALELTLRKSVCLGDQIYNQFKYD